ncbi:TonB-dependent receptor domain-containing protein [Alteraurantiacibacter aquimixticola]|uniref:TonB-dependent receptor n=1 Tax=Alteraurantiacibacter aquimixticola TaxID=2489173 RepID=A0A4T3EYA2_9SPHN|nr:TonB-dependent receptor [Alteraurantiacibacter aquimixticola]TIX48829.1 TonB-dependent receptor [Alteraurantiacibacter aquimixticola]
MQALSMGIAHTRRGLSTTAIAIGLLGALSNPAFAQDSDGAEIEEDEIIVTGSRVQRSTFDTPSPVTVFDSENIENLGLTDVGDIVSQLPANSNFFSSNNVGLGNFNVGAQFVNLRGLNPFFGTRTLTLVDTHRVVPTATGGGVDITLIPSMLVERTETVTGGASALYGSDAIAGVVNIILDKDLTGLRAQADFTRTDAGDGYEYHASAAFGTEFAGGRGHFVFGGEYQQTDAIGNCSEERGWCSERYGLFTNTGYATNGLPHYIIGPQAYSANQSLTGVLVPCTVFAGACINVPEVSGDLMQFNADGTELIPFNRGFHSTGAGFFGFRQDGDDEFSAGAYDGTTLRPEVERYTLLGHATYELGSNIELFLEGSYAHSAAVNPVATGAIGPYALEIFDRGYVGFRVFNDNAFLPAEAAALIGPAGAGFGRNMLSEQSARNETNNSTWRALGGLEGELGGGWIWDAYFSHGENKNDQHLFHNVVAPFLTFALDAVQTDGGIVCGVDVPGRINPNTGAPYTADDVAYANSAGPCVPLNLFGIGNADPAAVDYAFRTLEELSTIKQDVAAVNVAGDLFDGFGAGAVKLAAGAEWRRETVNVTHDLENTPFYNDFTLSYGLDYGGNIQVLEGYAELIVPVFENGALGRYFELDLAARGTSNKAKGTAGEYAGETASSEFVTWKVSALWDVTDWLRFRATRSRDVRAPQFRELFQTYNRTVGGPFGSVANPWNDGLTDAATITTGGNVGLEPEKADTWTVGVVLTPQGGALSGFRFSADWYEITIKDAIAGPPSGIGAANIVAQCFAGAQEFCDLMEGEGTDDITAITNTAANLQGFTTRGVDFEAAYNMPLGAESSLNVRVLASLLYDQLFSTGLGSPVYNYAGQTGPTAAFGTFNTSPKWQGNAFATYQNGPATLTLQMRYIGSGRYATLTGSGGPAVDPSDAGYDSTNPNSISDNKVEAAAYFNLSGSFEITDEIEMFGSINNLLDKDPVIAPGGNGFPTNPVYFDTFGRTYRIGARVRF